jgi:amino acid adenylation domain-containing protein
MSHTAADLAADLLAEMAGLGIRLFADGESLRFEAPAGVMTPALRDRLRQEKPALLDLLARTPPAPPRAAVLSPSRAEVPSPSCTAAPSPARAAPRPLAAGAAGSPAELSFQQERLWFLARLLPRSSAYHIPASMRLAGPLDRAALAAALTAAARRHEALRTIFPAAGRGHRPTLVILAPAPVPLPVADLRALPPARRAAEAARLAGAEAERPFDLARGPLWRATLVALAGEEHDLLLTQHHIVSDRWSTAVLFDDLGALYGAARTGAVARLPPLPIRYVDYAAWQRQGFAAGALDPALAYWRRQLAGTLPVLDLPIARPRPAGALARGAGRHFALAGGLGDGVRRLAGRAGVTPFMLLLAVHATLLGRYGEQEDIVIGTPVANRSSDATARLVGLFANLLVLRLDLSGAPTFAQLLERVRATALDAFDHQDLPFEKLVEDLNPERDLTRNPLFQAAFLLNSDAMPELQLPGIRCANLPIGALEPKFDLLFALQQTAAGFDGWIEHSAELFAPEAMARLAGHFAALLAAALAAPDRPAAELPLVAGAERQAILGAARGPDVPFAESARLDQLVAAQARRAPDAVAATCGPGALTYAAAVRAAAHLAARLERRGVRPGDLVGVCLPRGLGMIVALLGILRTGAAYVPLDPEHPEERRRAILARTACALLVTAATPGSPPASPERLAIVPVAALPQPAAPAAAPAGASAGAAAAAPAEGLAYVIFTSGSTGQPKGVMLQHQPVVNLVEWVNRTFAVGPRDRLLFTTSLTFDLSVYDIFGTLAAGGEVRVAAAEELAEPRRLAALLAGEGITFWDSAPAALQQLVPFLPRAPGDGAALRLVFLSGDWVPLALPPAIRARFPNARVVALGGATEAAIWSNFFPIAVVEPGWRSIPYGRPIQNARYHVLDAHLGLAPVEVPGDLYIGGRCLSLGYHGEPALTAERYRPDPFGPEPGAILYATGDRARRLPDGNLEFLGRRDTQVKIRGFRIELGEIESALRRHAAVREAVVLAREDRPGDRRLVAYVEPADGPAAAADGLDADLDAHLRAALPDYMLPAAFVFVERWPETANGKLDRRALAAPAAPTMSAALAEAAAAPPSGPLAAVLADLWRDVLGLETAGGAAHFFQLGGHSLLAIQAVAAIRDRLGADVPLQQLFLAPTPNELAAWIAGAGIAAEAGPALLPVPRQGDLPLSFAQERLWFLDRLEPESAAYVIAAALDLAGTLDRAALRRSLQRIADRHETLRTSFPARDGRPAAAVVPRLALHLPLADLAALPAAAAAAEARRLGAEGARRPFALDRPPLLRTTLVALAPGRHHLLLAIHHIVADAWSVGVILDELTAHYARERGSTLPPPAALAVQYLDYAAWQRQRLQGDELDRQLAYWRRQLAGAPPALELPADRPRPAAFRFRGGAVVFRVPEAALAALEPLRGATATTRFMLLLAVFEALLGRYAGRTDLLVGAPVANRDRAELTGLVGLFVNTLVLRADLAAAPTLRDLLVQARATVLAAFDHQDLPFDKLVEEINPGRDLGRNPLFQVVLTVEGAPVADRRLPGLTAAVLPLDNQTAKFDLHLDLTSGAGGGLAGRLEYNADLFAAPTLLRLGGHLANLLAAAAREPDRPLAELSLLSPAESWQLRGEWNDTAAARRGEPTLHGLFERRAAAAPERLAAACGGAWLSYGELDRRANRLANLLLARGAARGERIGVLLERSLDMLVALLAILKAGAAYVPLEIAHPAERHRHILEETGARLVVTHRGLGARLDRLPAAAVHLDGPAAAGLPATAPGRPAGDLDLAYIIFTSGSTGRPKGVTVQHRPAVNLVEWVNDTFAVGAADRLLFITSLSFDLSVYDVFGILAAGGTVHVATAAEIDEPADLARLIAGAAITFWDSAPAALQRLVPFLPPAGAGSRALRLAFLSGDWIPLSLPPALAAAFPALQVVALGGATEATVWSNVHPIRALDPDWRSVPYGRPIRRASYHVLDLALAPCPLGVPGALHIGGDVLSLGYWRQPALTAERYLPDPFGAPGGRLYVTGDRARWRPGQLIEFLGRVDAQLKIRGYRVEPGEAEAVLREHPGVREAVVAAVADPRGDHQLAAWVEPHPAGPLAELDGDAIARLLRGFLGQRLPEYLVPARWARIAAWPVTANGKLDRAALPVAALPAGGDAAALAAAPRSAAEEILASLWGEILAVPAVAAGDDFFALGGHSILLAQLAARLRQSFAVEIPLRRLFESPTLAAQAALVAEAARPGAAAAPRPPLARLPAGAAAPLSHAQERLWVEHRRQPGSAAYNVPFAFRLHGLLDLPAFHRAVGALAARHEALRTTIVLAGDEPVQRVAPPAAVPVPLVDLAALPTAAMREAAARRRLDEEALTPFDLERGPLFRVRLLRLAADHHLAVFDLHHIVCDGWSIAVLRRELGPLYQAALGRAAGEDGTAAPAPLAPLPITYRDFAVWQRGWLAGDSLAALLDAWRRTLAGAPPSLDLPGQRPRPAVMSDRGGSLDLALSADLTAALHAMARRHGCTLFMVLVAAFDVALHHLTRREDLVVGTDLAGRDHPDLDGLVGFFINQVALRTSLAGNPTCGEIVARVRTALLAAYSLQEAPFSLVVDAVKPPRDLGRTPIFQVKIGLQAPAGAPPTLPGLTLAEVPVGGRTAKHDLWLNLWESQGILAGRLEHNLDTVRRTTAAQLLRAFELLLTELTAGGDPTLAELDERLAAALSSALPAGLAAGRAALVARRLGGAARTAGDEGTA